MNINDFGINDITYDSDALMYYTDPMKFEENFMNDITNDINDIIDNTIRDAAANDNSMMYQTTLTLWSRNLMMLKLNLMML